GPLEPLRQRLADAAAGFHPWPPAAAVLLPFLVGLVLMPLFIGLLARAGMGQRIREEGPSSHLAKGGTPTAGGLAVILLLLLGLLMIDRRPEVLPVLAALVLGAALGLVDDLATVRGQARGLRARQRIVVQAGIGLVIGYLLLRAGADAQLVPVIGTWQMGWLVVPAAALALVAAANAFNLTDGSDGLAPGVMVVVAVVLALMVRAHDNDVALVRLLLVTAGALLAFLAYNLPPARVFLGGVGSEGLGMLLAAAAIAGGLMWFLPLLAIVPVLETLSVIIQVYFFRTTGRRVFRMSPLHHHFQLGGWSEWTVALSAWATSSLAGTISLLLVRRPA
ncbi:MAG: phospho-N-acetylmuramoyl-pentapeptide-transferase, partial [Chloroflexota bacterium]|nr:phospho-N-acetylmuramoyl-pentapeptide-transferase [Chloroflexota bacterium]